MGRIFLLVGTGGFSGSIARYLSAIGLTKHFLSAFPYGTFAANILGCLLIGVVFGLGQRFEWLTPELRLFLATGFCGGFTTFSSFTLENTILLQNSNYFTFAIYAISSFSVGLLAVFGGITVTKI
ncbi:fluoride efflux transporter CrcB [Aequorivita sp. CIP111184]|uniref:fluoride efflux transporter CrcB n=1 Tax=Aequorivita sp. CIP111184 TaxID=2211356 RepID=UPI000DBC223A|nr:fluoride efflux transporter CrcB [Aequorivita sp. CIP111184]SRX53864.1 Putative fluoride ion transporter CrcB [Aequorivita sp. CIP111184]